MKKTRAMKKIQILSAVVLAMAMTACVHEENFSNVKLGDDEFAFSISKITTKSAVETEAPHSYQLGNSGFSLEETVTSLDVNTVDTKGTPIYTENIEKYYSTINVVGYQAGGSDVFVPEASYEYNSESSDNKKVYYHHYSSDPWPAEDQEQTLWFFLKAPQDYLDETATDFEYGTSDGSIEFDYGSPLNGENQKDILFTSRTLTKAEYFDNPNFHSQGGAPVTFYHALTAVKFRTANDNAGTTKTIITKVEFTGLNASGHCKVTPTEGQVSKENVAWSNLGTNGVVFTQEFENSAYSKEANVDNTIDYDSSNSNFGSSWTSAASTKNLNDEDGSLTFWFIPQEISEDVTLKVTFRVKTPDTPNGTEITHTIKFGETLNAQGVEWKAGQLRTYTLKPLDVDVDIFDTMEGWIKNDVHVTNTGNVHEYVRMTFVGNWYDENGNIVVGYKTDGSGGENDNEMVLPWYGVGYPCTDPNDPSTIDLSLEDDEAWQANKKYADPYGYFDESFLLTNIAEGSKWVRASGGYYYKEPIGPGVELDSKTQALFQSYTLTNVPTIYVPTAGSSTRVPAEGIHLVFEMAVQAIYAPVDEDGNETSTWYAEWYDATGNPKLNPDTIPSNWE